MEVSISEKLMHQFHHLSRAIHEKQMSARGMDLLQGQGRLLRTLEMEDGISQKELADRVRIRPASLSELIGKMEQKGYIRREVDERDRRVFNIYIADEGRQLAQHTREARDTASNEIFSVLSEPEQKQLLELMEKLLGGLQKGR